MLALTSEFRNKSPSHGLECLADECQMSKAFASGTIYLGLESLGLGD